MTAAQINGMILNGGLSVRDRVVLDELYDYALDRENGKVFHGVCEEAVRCIITHRQHKGRLVFHRDGFGDIDGMFMWYRFAAGWKEEDKIEGWGDDDEGGEELYLAATFADDAGVRRWGILKFLEKEPDALHLKLSMTRLRGGQPTRIDANQKMLARLLK
jgi:hypothetical protein